jgi:hypothetical protein
MYPLPHPERIDGRGMGVIYAPEDVKHHTWPPRSSYRQNGLHADSIECSPSTLNKTRNGDTGAEMQAQLPYPGPNC